jgi:two-component sensor histidine kinase/PAS domain-containing protein
LNSKEKIKLRPSMTKDDDVDTRIAALQKEILRLRELLQQHGVDAADAAMKATQRDYRHERELRAEHDATSAADLRAEAEGERADRAELNRTKLEAQYDEFVRNSNFNRQVLESTTDCIEVLDLDGKLVFMNAGGMRVMEIDDFLTAALCPWSEFWRGEEQVKAAQAVALAKAGRTARFEGQAPTAKGNVRWWEVTVSPIFDPNGKPEKLLSISRDVTDRHAAEETRRTLFEEMHHRIKNTLSTVQSIIQQSLRQSTGLPEANRSIGQRLTAMGKAHDLLIQNEWISADIRQVVRDAVKAYAGGDTRLNVEGQSVEVSSKAALSIAMLMNELCTNAVKYGAWSNNTGVVNISWSHDSGTFHFRWIEQLGPRVIQPARHSFGSRLITYLVPAELGGSASVAYDPAGFRFQLDAPLSNLRAI